MTEAPTTPFEKLSDYVALPRLAGLAIAPDSSRLVTSVTTVSADKKKYVTALWEIDPTGRAPARRLTRSAPGEAGATFRADGTILFTSRRPNPDSTDNDDEVPALWALPADGGEAYQVADRPGGIGDARVATGSGDVVFTSAAMPGTTDAESDKKAREARDKAGVSAILYETYPVRFWDHDIGPDEARLFAAGDTDPISGRFTQPRDLTPEPNGELAVDSGYAISPDGSQVAVIWKTGDVMNSREALVLIDTATGDRRVLADEARHLHAAPAFLPDGRSVVCVRAVEPSPTEPLNMTLWHVDLETGAGRDLTPDFDLWPGPPVVSPDGTAVFFVADELGHAPVFRLSLADGSITRLTSSGAYGDVVVAADGSALYALRASMSNPALPVRLDPNTPDQDGVPLRAPGDDIRVPGRVEEVTATAQDGTPLRSWLALPDNASADNPVPLVLFIHGGPHSSNNAWSWRWNPWLMVARGYAVLLPDPALSTGYGQEFHRRGVGQWGGNPYTDIMALTDVTEARADIDAERTAAMGGSFGGYMANWVAGHTDRFKAIVTHASLWNLDSFAGTTDESSFWYREIGDPRENADIYRANSPHRFVENIRTPMLVIHGAKDYRVPIGEGIALWFDLMRHAVNAKYLYFPSENHWVLTPGHATVWYETVFAFLAEHVLGEKWVRPNLL